MVLGVVLMIRLHDLLWLFLSLPFSVMLWIAARYAPQGYRLGTDGVHVERKVGEAVIAYRDIRGVDRERRPYKGLSFGASTGLFGRFGKFWNPQLGFFRLFLANTHTIVWLSTAEGWVGLSPERADEFCTRLEARLVGRPRAS